MTKRISCKVIKSFPLVEAAKHSIHFNQPKNKRDHSDCVVDVNTELLRDVSTISDLISYTHSLGISKIALDSQMTGQALDCYA